jgi:hypothetical protein
MMKSLIRGVALAALTVLVAIPAQAEKMQHEAAGIEFDLPTGWTSEAEGDNAIRVKNADGSVEVVLAVAEKDSVEDVAKDVASEVDDYLKDVKVDGEGKSGEFNGMPMWSVSGTGTYEEEPWAWDVTIFMVNKPVVVLSWATPEVLKSPSDDVVAFFQSVKKISA